jgi:hypothetical protein
MKDDPQAMLLADLDNLRIMQLRKKYRGEAISHSNMLARTKSKDAKVHPDFHAFRDFLRYVGPKSTPKASLDRIDNNDPEYAPGKVRWADRKTQNNNKGDSLSFHCRNTGRHYTASQLAKKQEVTPTAIRNRRRHGWTDAEIISGHRRDQKPLIAPTSKLSPVPTYRPTLSRAEIQFNNNREMCEDHRLNFGEEYFIATPVEVFEIFSDASYFSEKPDWVTQTEKSFLVRKLPKWWREFKPHVNFLALKPHQQEWILRIDPDQASKFKGAPSL